MSKKIIMEASIYLINHIRRAFKAQLMESIVREGDWDESIMAHFIKYQFTCQD